MRVGKGRKVSVVAAALPRCWLIYALFIFLFNRVYLDVYSAGSRFSERRIQVDCWGETGGLGHGRPAFERVRLIGSHRHSTKIILSGDLSILYRDSFSSREIAEPTFRDRFSVGGTYVGTSRRPILEAIDRQFRMLGIVRWENDHTGTVAGTRRFDVGGCLL